MNVKSNVAKSFLDGLLDESEVSQIVNDVKNSKSGSKDKFIVYYPSEGNPDVAYIYHGDPPDGIPYIQRYGYWQEEGKSRKFVENTGKNFILNHTIEQFLENERFIPNKNMARIFDCEEDFILDMM